MKSVTGWFTVGGGSGRRMLPALLLLFTLCALRFPAHAASIYPSAGTTSASFLKIGVGARAVAMGGAYAALSDDAYAVYWNPAGLAQPLGTGLAFTHNDYFEGLKQEYFGFTLPGEKIGFLKGSRFEDGGFGLGFNYLSTPSDLERRSGLNEAFGAISPVEGKFGAYDLAFSGAYGFNYSRDLRLGAALKFIRQSIDNDSGNTAALDLGAQYDFAWLDRQFTGGFAVQNLGPGVKFNSRRFDLPLVFRAGLSHRLYERGLLLALDLYKPVDNYPSLALGLEHPLANRLFLRAGYRYRQHGNELGAFSGFSAGLGFAYSQFSFDYAFSPFGDLGVTHRISLAYRFPVPAAAQPVRPEQSVPAADKLEGASLFNYTVSKKALKISPRGIDYAVEAVSEQAAAVRLAFRTRQRGGGDIPVEVLEGALPAGLAAGLPAGYSQVDALQLGAGFGGVSGGLDLNFKFPEEKVKDKKTDLFYRVSGGWRKAELIKGECAAGVCPFSAKAPLSSHYVFAVK